MVDLANSSTNYLSLALYSRRTIKALLAAEENGVDNAELRKAVNDAIESLKVLNSAGETVFVNLHAPSYYEHYEQMSTLQEVQSAMKDDQIVEKLSSVTRNDAPEEKKIGVEFAIRFFHALENRALQKFYRSSGAAIDR